MPLPFRQPALPHLTPTSFTVISRVPLLPTILAALSTVIGLLSCLTLVVLLLASGANSTPAQAAQIKMLVLVTLCAGMAALVGAVLCLIWGRPWTAAIVGGVPTVWMIGFITWAFLREW